MPDSKQKQSRDLAFDTIRSLEDVMLNMYDDKSKVPTIGVGYAAIVMGKNDWAVKETLEADMRAVGAPLSARNLQTLNEITREKNKGDKADEDVIKSKIGSLSEVSITREQSRDLYDLSYDRSYDALRSIVGAAAFEKTTVPERAALTIATYQSRGAISRHQDEIRDGINEGNPDKVTGALVQIGEELGDPIRYNTAADKYDNQRSIGKIQVRPGETLSELAVKHGTTVNAFMAANPQLPSPGNIRMGGMLTIPEGAVTAEDVYAAYAQQGIPSAEADIHWADQVKSHKNGARLAALGLTVREARVMNDVVKGLDITGQGYSGPEMAAATRYSSTLERTNGDHDAAMRYAREGLAEARTYSGPSQEFSPGDQPFSAKDIKTHMDSIRGSVTVPQKQNKRASLLNTQDTLSITVQGVPKGATLSAGTTSAPAPRPVRSLPKSQMQKDAERQAREMMGLEAPTRQKQKKKELEHGLGMITNVKDAKKAVKSVFGSRVNADAYLGLDSAIDGVGRIGSVLNGPELSTRQMTGTLKTTKQDGQKIGTAVGALVGRPTIDKLMRSPAYSNALHPEHETVANTVRG